MELDGMDQGSDTKTRQAKEESRSIVWERVWWKL